MKKYTILFLISLVIFPVFKLVNQHRTQHKINILTKAAGYPEIKGITPTFNIKIETDNSVTYVFSYLPKTLLSRKNFDEEAAKKAISYIEKFVLEKNEFAFSPKFMNDDRIDVKMLPRIEDGKAENFVFFVTDGEPLAEILKNQQDIYSHAKEALINNKTLYWTVFRDNGSTSFLRYVDKETWKYGLPTSENIGITPIQQLNVGFNIEIWKRSARIVSVDPIGIEQEASELLFDASESLWNTFGQLVAFKQEMLPLELIIERIENKIINKVRNRAYYPFDEKAQRLYEGAPSEPIIR